MAANALAAFTKSGKMGQVELGAVNTKSDGTGTIGTDLWLAFTADATNGSYIRFVRFQPTVTASTATGGVAMTPTTLRVFVSSVTSGATTAANTTLWGEVSMTAQTADHNTNSTFALDVPCNFWLPAGYTILVSTHVVAAASTKVKALVVAGDY